MRVSSRKPKRKIETHPRPKTIIFTPPVSTPTERDAARTDMSMLAVCCEPLEVAIGAGVLVAAGERLFVRAGTRAWFISFCPWCGEKRT